MEHLVCGPYGVIPQGRDLGRGDLPGYAANEVHPTDSLTPGLAHSATQGATVTVTGG